jgi:hypothetical protein
MAQLSTKIKLYAAANGVASVDFRTDVMLQDDSNGAGAYIKEWEPRHSTTDSSTIRMLTRHKQPLTRTTKKL